MRKKTTKLSGQTETVFQKKLTKKELITRIVPKKTREKFLSDNQRIYYEILHKNQIIIVRPAVEAEEKLGALPGNVEEKLDPYIFPSYYLLNKIIGKESREKLKEIEAVEVFALAYMRGMNIDNSILIFEEAQNCSPKQMKLLLTRIGYNSKFFISGDLEQTDRYKDIKHSGLWDAIEKFRNIDDIGVFEFQDYDIVRNPLISKILTKYE
jgi:phosphate starvation-inducible PhoH-like protein